MGRVKLEKANQELLDKRKTVTAGSSNNGLQAEKPDPWVCPECGHIRDPYWNRWKEQWILYDGDCEGCESLRIGKQWLKDHKKQLLANHGLDTGEYGHMTLDTYQPNPKYPNQRIAKKAVQSLINDWKHGHWRSGIMLYSQDVGIGKTHLAVAAARVGVQIYTPAKLGERIFSIWDMPSYIKATKNSYNDGKTQEVQRSAAEPAILVMDDLGAEYVATGEWYQGLMYDILNARWRDQKATLATTNLDTDELRAKVGNRAFSRLISLTGKPIAMSGDDYRLWG